MSALRRVTATRYVAALREGGSLPGLVEADDDGLYVTKFRGAGQGEGALVAEVVAGELGAGARACRSPSWSSIDVAPELGHAEPDPEIQELIAASPGTEPRDGLPARGAAVHAARRSAGRPPTFAADVVWFDALVTNVDRTPRNPNLLVWHGRTWLIDHGAAFFRQYGDVPLAHDRAHAPSRCSPSTSCCPDAGPIARADERLAAPALAAVPGAVGAVPDAWLGADPAARRADFAAFLRERLAAPRVFVEELEHARG